MGRSSDLGWRKKNFVDLIRFYLLGAYARVLLSGLKRLDKGEDVDGISYLYICLYIF